MASPFSKRSFRSGRNRIAVLLTLASTGLALLIIFAAVQTCQKPPAAPDTRQEELLIAAGKLRSALDEYALGNGGSYPANFDELSASGLLEAMPLNPYSGSEMRELPIEAEITSGDFSYAALEVDESGRAKEYVLLVYGDGSLGSSALPEAADIPEELLGRASIVYSSSGL